MGQYYTGNINIHTDDSLHEEREHGTSDFPFSFYNENINQFDSMIIDWHWHSEVEFLTVKSGEIVCSTGREDIMLNKGDSVFINSSVVHRFTAKDSAVIPNIVFAPAIIAPRESLIYEKYVMPLVTRGPGCVVFDHAIEWHDTVNSILSEIYMENSSHEPDELYILNKITELWDIICKHVEYRPENEEKGEALRQVRLRSMMQYIHDNYKDDVTLEDVARAGLVGKSSALGIFRTEIKESPIAYLIRYRLMRAAQMLEESDKSVSIVAQENGFSSSGYFCRKFVEFFHESPGKYRKARRADKA